MPTKETRPRVKQQASRDMVGETLGNYRIISEIGVGGMGVVYLAEHTKLGRRVAVKVLRNDVAADLVERFFTEAKAAAALHHPNLVDVFDFGQEHGSAYIAMEFLAGESLAERLEHDPRLQLPVALAITRSIANALHVAHELGIVHRDLKPANIFLVEDPEAPAGVRPKVLDFGIAKLLRDQEPRSVRTHSGTLMGTPRYMSPEQCKNAKSVDGRSDIYALGCILFEMLMGVAPFDYDTWAELVAAHLHEQPPRPTDLDPTLPKDVETLLVKMLEKNPDARQRSMQELAQAIEVLQRDFGGGNVRVTPPTGLRRPSSRDAGSTDPTMPAAGDLTPSSPPQLVVRPSEPTPAPARSIPWVAIAIGFAAVVAALIAVFALRDRGERGGQAVIVVDNQATPPAPDAAPVEPPPPAPEPAVTVVEEDPAKSVVPKRATIEPAQLERAFAKQKSQLAACFRAHPDEARGEQLAMRFQIDARGNVLAAEVVPASVGATAFGKCLVGVARATKFGAQPQAATFRIPINAS